MRWFWAPVLGLLGACSGPAEPECGGWEQVFVYADADGDGFGADRIGWLCAPGPDQSVTAGDCDDGDPTSYPTADELCDTVDNDCNGVVDDGIALLTWYEDHDGDTFGGQASQPSCAPPDPAWVGQAGDCDDDDPEVNPLVREVCNGWDDDCDGRSDDEDGGVDPTTQIRWYRDADSDGYGDDNGLVEACDAPGALFILQAGDCDDTRAGVNPDRTEICNLHDDDCDTWVDDEDPSIDPSGQSSFFTDADLDGYGDPNSLTLACRPIPGAVTNDDDCDDTEPTATVIRDWFVDADWDGVGAGVAIATACHSPGLGTGPGGNDCNDLDPLQFPGNPEICEDGFDQDCSGSDRVCATWLYTVKENGDVLERIDLETNTIERVGPLGVTFDFGDLAYDPGSRTMYMIDGRGAQALYTVDLTTGAATLVGAHNLSDLFGLAWDTSTSSLYASRWFPFGLYELDPLTGAAANFVGNPNIELGALAYDSARDDLLAMNEGPGNLNEISRSNANLTFLTNGGFVNNSGMAYEPVGDMIYVIDWSGDLYQYDPNNNYARTTVLFGLQSHDGLVFVADPPN